MKEKAKTGQALKMEIGNKKNTNGGNTGSEDPRNENRDYMHKHHQQNK